MAKKSISACRAYSAYVDSKSKSSPVEDYLSALRGQMRKQEIDPVKATVEQFNKVADEYFARICHEDSAAHKWYMNVSDRGWKLFYARFHNWQLEKSYTSELIRNFNSK